MAIIYVALGLVIAVIGGTIIEKLHMEPYVEEFIFASPAAGAPREESALSQRERLIYARDQMLGTFKKVFPHILVGGGDRSGHPQLDSSDLGGDCSGQPQPLWGDSGHPGGSAHVRGYIRYHPGGGGTAGQGAQLGTILSFMMAVTTLSLPSLIMLRKAVNPGCWPCLWPSVWWVSFWWAICSTCSSSVCFKII